VRLLADENLPREAVEALRAAGHDVAWIAEDAPSITDLYVLARACAEQRVVVTSDKDFGELAFHTGMPALFGIVLLRVPPMLSDLVADLAVRTLASNPDLRGKFWVVDPAGAVRVRDIPGAP
jgi:predicted nuclease of predicted toxin-antitoxin system